MVHPYRFKPSYMERGAASAGVSEIQERRRTRSAVRADGVVPEMSSVDPLKAASEAECVVIVTDHKNFDYAKLVEKSKLIVDTRNALAGLPVQPGQVSKA